MKSKKQLIEKAYGDELELMWDDSMAVYKYNKKLHRLFKLYVETLEENNIIPVIRFSPYGVIEIEGQILDDLIIAYLEDFIHMYSSLFPEKISIILNGKIIYTINNSV